MLWNGPACPARLSNCCLKAVLCLCPYTLPGYLQPAPPILLGFAFKTDGVSPQPTGCYTVNCHYCWPEFSEFGWLRKPAYSDWPRFPCEDFIQTLGSDPSVILSYPRRFAEGRRSCSEAVFQRESSGHSHTFCAPSPWLNPNLNHHRGTLKVGKPSATLIEAQRDHINMRMLQTMVSGNPSCLRMQLSSHFCGIWGLLRRSVIYSHRAHLPPNSTSTAPNKNQIRLNSGFSEASFPCLAREHVAGVKSLHVHYMNYMY